METNMIILAGLGLAVSAAAAWWMKNRSTTISSLADAIEDKIEDVTGIDLELDDVVEDVVAEAEEVAEEVLEAVEDSLKRVILWKMSQTKRQMQQKKPLRM